MSTRKRLTGLRVVLMVILAEVELRGITVDGQWRLCKVRLVLPFTVTVRLIAGSPGVAIDPNGPVAMDALRYSARRRV